MYIYIIWNLDKTYMNTPLSDMIFANSIGS